MYCPKCKQNFEEGSRRFCPTDGARLVSEADTGGGKAQGGIFANLIPQMEGISDLGKALANVPGVIVSDLESEKRPDLSPAEPDDDVFFEIDEPENGTLEMPAMSSLGEPVLDLEPSASTDSIIPPSEPVLPVIPAARKVDPNTIPAGHVILGQGDFVQPAFPDFDLGNPNGFVGRVVKGRYRVLEYLGGDESGVAYIADDRIGDKKVVVRIMIREEADDLFDSILAEERVSLSHFSHPNIARLIDSGEFSNGNYFLISEYIDALSVADVLSIHGNFSPQRAARVIRQVSIALNEAHQEGILHRDIRPENLILDPGTGDSEQARLVNFGTYKSQPTDRNLGYQSPEVLDGRINTVVSDIYSLAVVAFEMLTGKLPFEGSSPREVLKAQYAGMSQSVTDLRPEFPAAINGVFEKALSFTSSGRYKKARDFGDAFSSALSTVQPVVEQVAPKAVSTIDLLPLVPAIPAAPDAGKPPKASVGDVPTAKKEPMSTSIPVDHLSGQPAESGSRNRFVLLGGLFAVLAAAAFGWYYLSQNPGFISNSGGTDNTSSNLNTNAAARNSETPPLPRTLAQPPSSNVYQNSKDNLKGDLVTNFLGFTLFYPKDWEVNDPIQGGSGDARGKFLDISRSTPDGRLQEQMLISYYPSGGTFAADSEKFSQMVAETNQTLEKILPGYQMVSQGEHLLNGSWRAYEVKFQGGGTSPSGEKLIVWGRRLFVPVSRAGARNGYEITMLATSLAKNVQGVDEVGVKGELGPILYSFEPGQNY